MKKTILFLIIIALSVQACDLKEHSYTEAGKDNYPLTAAEAETVLMGIYQHMGKEGMYAYHLSLLFTISSDIAQCEGSATSSFRAIPTNTHTASLNEISVSWQELYSAIYDANDFIETVSQRMESWDEANRSLATVYLAEARALRALFYFELLRWWGNVPLVRTTSESRQAASLYRQATPEEVFAFIENDLKWASDHLPWALDDTVRSHSEYRISKGAALGLLCKVYCTWAGNPLKDNSKWADAAAVARSVIISGKHDLNPDFEALWRNTCNGVWEPLESLIEVSFYSPTALNSSDPTGRIGKWNGVSTTAIAGVRGRNAANWKVVYPFVQEWMSHNDPRLWLSVANYKYGHASNGEVVTDGYITYEEIAGSTNEDRLNRQRQLFTPAKWDTEKYVSAANALINNDKSNVNWYVLRYAEVLLLYAEAVNELVGPTTEAVQAFNKVRRRAFGDTEHDLPLTISQDVFRDAMRHERAYELCFEGHRKQDLIRWGIYYQTIMETAQKVADWYPEGNYTVARYTIEGKHELMPIPQRECDLMKGIQQNDAWK